MNAENFLKLVRVILQCTYLILIFLVISLVYVINPTITKSDSLSDKEITLLAVALPPEQVIVPNNLWTPPDSMEIKDRPMTDLLRYGRELIAHTSYYLGPNGVVSQQTNGMNCQNCHLSAGSKVFGNSYAAVAANYPKMRSRSGSVESVARRVNDCIERSLNGVPLDTTSKEMAAFIAYITWVGKDVAKNTDPNGRGIYELPFLDRPASVEKGKVVYETHCLRCHGDDGQGQLADNGKEWMYPPLWGDHSYNVSAGLYRLSRFAGYVKTNMPFGVTFENPQLTNEQAWDVAAYVNSQPRPEKKFSDDWPDISKKPFDHPFGPYADGFSEEEHKYGPFKPIKELQIAKRK